MFLRLGQLLPTYISSGQFLSDIWSTGLDWTGTGLSSLQIIVQKVVTPITMLENILDFIGYGLTVTGIICLGITCYKVMYEEGFGFQIMFKAGVRLKSSFIYFTCCVG